MMIRQRLRSWLWRAAIEDEVREELELHVELRARELEMRGVPADRARAEARRRLGPPGRIEADLARLGRVRNRWWALGDWLAELGQDSRFAMRQAWLQPGFTLAAVLTLAIGLGATTAIFSVVHAVVLAPLPVADPERVLAVFTTSEGQRGNTSVGNFDYIRRRAGMLEPLAAAHFVSFNLAGVDLPERVRGVRSTASYFEVFGIRPIVGRTFGPDEDQPGRQGVVVLSERLWRRRFAADAAVVGRQIRLDQEPYQIIGVMPESFDALADGAELFVPIAFTPERLAMYDEHFLDLYGRRRADVSLAQVNDELARVAADLEHDHPAQNFHRGAVAEQLDTWLVGDYRLRLYVLLGAVLLVLAIACGNAANLVLARLAARSRELAIRSAIGAGRWRIVRQVLAESLILAGLGAAAGMVLAGWTLPLLVASAPEGVPRLADARLSPPVLYGAVAATLVTALIVGALPAWYATSGQLRGALSESRGAGRQSLRPWLRQTLVGAQAALVLVVLAAAALLVRSAINLQQVPIGFDTGSVLRARLGLPAAEYRTPVAVRATFDDLLGRLSQSPAVAFAAIDSQAPLLDGGGSNGLIPEGRPLRMESVILSRSHFVTPDYFRVLGITGLEGRSFSTDDIRTAPLVMIVNETFARQAFPGQDPIGKRIACCEGGPDAPMWKTIVGVVPDIRSGGPAREARPEFYLPVAQIPDVAWSWIQNTMDVIVRPVSGPPEALTDVIRSTVKAVDPSVPVYAVQTMDQGLRRTTAQARFNMWLMTLLGLIGLALAAIGIYSVIAWLVEQRRREIGVRMALGASPSSVVRQVVSQGLVPVSTGLAIGLAGAMASGRLLEGQLFEVRAGDPATLAVTAAILLTVAAIAALIPARRATAIDPARALHDG